VAKDRERQKNSRVLKVEKQIKEIENKIEQNLIHLQEIRESRLCFPFLGVEITKSIVDDVFDDLRNNYKNCDGRLDIIVDSGGGDIDAAYNLSLLFRKYGFTELNFIVPRWAKSAATLLVCSGDKILMSPIAELGPLDPQITQINPLEGRLEQFSPLHIESTLDMIRQEFEKGNDKLAKGLMERLQFPLTLGSFKKSLEVGEQYLSNLLETRMLSSEKNTAKAKDIAKRLTHGYADHGFCINIDEAINIGLDAFEITGEEMDTVWEIHRLNNKKKRIQKDISEEKVINMIKELPPDLMDKAVKLEQQNPADENSKHI